jgi:hypothetical protein
MLIYCYAFMQRYIFEWLLVQIGVSEPFTGYTERHTVHYGFARYCNMVMWVPHIFYLAILCTTRVWTKRLLKYDNVTIPWHRVSPTFSFINAFCSIMDESVGIERMKRFTLKGMVPRFLRWLSKGMIVPAASTCVWCECVCVFILTGLGCSVLLYSC